MPARSLKNQPHDVYMSIAWRWASSSVSASTASAPGAPGRSTNAAGVDGARASTEM